jgi:ribose transport system substrate-binding protein
MERTRFTASLLMVVLVLAMVMGSTTFAASRITVAVMLPNVGDTYFQTKWYGYSQQAKKLGVNAIMYDAGGYANVSKQIGQVEDVIQKKVDAIIYHPCNSEAGVPVIEEAIKAGIKVVNDNQPCPAPGIHATIMRDFYAIGRSFAQFVVQESNAKGNVLILPGPVGGEQNIQLLNGQKDYFARFPKCTIIDTQFCGSNAADGLKVMEDMIQAHPKLKYVTCFGDQIAQGVVQALRAAGKKPGQVKVICFNMADLTKQMFLQGWITAIDLGEPVWMAKRSMELAYNLVKGKKVPKNTWTREVLITNKNMLKLVDLRSNTIPAGWKP